MSVRQVQDSVVIPGLPVAPAPSGRERAGDVSDFVQVLREKFPQVSPGTDFRRARSIGADGVSQGVSVRADSRAISRASEPLERDLSEAASVTDLSSSGEQDAGSILPPVRSEDDLPEDDRLRVTNPTDLALEAAAASLLAVQSGTVESRVCSSETENPVSPESESGDSSVEIHSAGAIGQTDASAARALWTAGTAAPVSLRQVLRSSSEPSSGSALEESAQQNVPAKEGMTLLGAVSQTARSVTPPQETAPAVTRPPQFRGSVIEQAVTVQALRGESVRPTVGDGVQLPMTPLSGITSQMTGNSLPSSRNPVVRVSRDSTDPVLGLQTEGLDPVGVSLGNLNRSNSLSSLGQTAVTTFKSPLQDVGMNPVSGDGSALPQGATTAVPSNETAGNSSREEKLFSSPTLEASPSAKDSGSDSVQPDKTGIPERLSRAVTASDLLGSRDSISFGPENGVLMPSSERGALKTPRAEDSARQSAQGEVDSSASTGTQGALEGTRVMQPLGSSSDLNDFSGGSDADQGADFASSNRGPDETGSTPLVPVGTGSTALIGKPTTAPAPHVVEMSRAEFWDQIREMIQRVRSENPSHLSVEVRLQDGATVGIELRMRPTGLEASFRSESPALLRGLESQWAGFLANEAPNLQITHAAFENRSSFGSFSDSGRSGRELREQMEDAASNAALSGKKADAKNGRGRPFSQESSGE